MKKIILILMIITISVFGKDNLNWDTVFEQNLNRLSNDTLNQIEKDKLIQKNNTIYQQNVMKEILAKKNIPDYVFKKPKEILIFVRKDYHKINGKFIVMDSAGWKRVIVKQKQEWDY